MRLSKLYTAVRLSTQNLLSAGTLVLRLFLLANTLDAHAETALNEVTTLQKVKYDLWVNGPTPILSQTESETKTSNGQENPKLLTKNYFANEEISHAIKKFGL